MIIDFHCHIGRLRGMSTSGRDAVERMDRLGFEWSVVVTFPQAPDNEYVLNQAQAFPDRLIPFVALNPWRETSAAELAVFLDRGAKGLKLHPIAHGFSLDDHDLLDPLLDLCAEAGVPVLAHCTADVLCVPNSLGDLARTQPNVPFIMAHMGHMYDTAGAISTALRWPNIYLETSHSFFRSIRKAAQAIGDTRMLFGTDAPHSDADWEIEKLTLAIADSSARERIVGKNAAKILGIAYP